MPSVGSMDSEPSGSIAPLALNNLDSDLSDIAKELRAVDGLAPTLRVTSSVEQMEQAPPTPVEAAQEPLDQVPAARGGRKKGTSRGRGGKRTEGAPAREPATRSKKKAKEN